MATPDVTVVVAVYNTMPYLERCLDSLVAQSIGADRMEVIAVDDGSTDDSGVVLDKYAAAHPDLFRVLHQENSGGPAAPSNRALEVARGRYLYFLGADDYLGPEALERMVAFADEHGSDVVIGRMVGVNGRGVHQGLYKDGNIVDLDPYGPQLRWAIANTKLFRRELTERLGLRYREDMPFGSDQPYTLTACVNARRISVLADYPCYYAVQREDRSNISYKTPITARVENIRQMMQTVVDLVPEGSGRDTILVRHFAWEVTRLLRRDLATAPESEQREVCAGVRRMADAWLTPDMLDELPVWARLRVVAAAREDLDLLVDLVDRDVVHADLIHLEGGQALAVLPGFRTTDLSDRLYRMAPVGVAGRLRALARLQSVRVEGGRLLLEVHLPLVGPEADTALSARLDGPDTARRTSPEVAASSTTDEAGTTVRVAVALKALAAAGRGPWRLVLAGEVAAGPFDVPVPGPSEEKVERFWARGRPHFVRVRPAPRGKPVAIVAEPVTPRQVVAGLARRIARA